MHHLQKLLLITIPKIVIYFNSLIIGLNNFIQEIDYFFITIRVTEIDNMQRATLVPLKDDAAPLKKKVPYDQLRPYLTSELHDGTSPPESKTATPHHHLKKATPHHHPKATPPSPRHHLRMTVQYWLVIVHNSFMTVHHNLTMVKTRLTRPMTRLTTTATRLVIGLTKTILITIS